MRILESIAQDWRYVCRTLRHSPAFTATAILSLALGIGANTAVFSVLNAVMLKMLPVREPQRLVELARSGLDDNFTYALWDQIRNRHDIFSGVFAWGGTNFDLASGGEKHPAQGLYVSGDYFRTPGVRPLIGRLLEPSDDDRGKPNAVAVLSYGFWQRQYARDPKILERTIRLDGHSFQIVGITPPGFFGMYVGETFDVAVPLTSLALIHAEDTGPLDNRSYYWLNIVGRLKDGASSQKAAARLKVLAPQILRVAMDPDLKPHEQRNFLQTKLALKPASTGLSNLRDQYGRGLLLLMAMVGFVLLIACANVANLLLARATARQREIAVRMAIGAGRWQIVRQLLTESLVVALLGAALGILFAYWGSRLLIGLISSTADFWSLDLTPDLRVLLFTVVLALLTGILFGFAPALQATHATPAGALKEGAHVLTQPRRGRWSLGRLLVIGQVALSLVLLAGAGLFVRSLYKLLTQDMGFEREGVMLVDPDLSRLQSSPAREILAADQLLDRIRSTPQVVSAGRAAVTPISGTSWQWDIKVDRPDGSRKSIHCHFNLVSPGYFQTLGTPLRAGRDFTSSDSKTSPPVAIINETAARKLFPGVNAIGQKYYDAPALHKGKEPPVEIVGLAKDAKYRKLRDAVPPTIYLPIAQNPAPFPVVGEYLAKFAGSPKDVSANIKAALRDFDPRLGMEFRLLSTQVSNSLLQEKLLAKLASFFGLLALLLASIGLYGVVAYSVARRRNEIGIRMALGAGRQSVIWLVLRDLAKLLISGIILGLSLALALTRFARSVLYGLSPADPATLVSVCLLLIIVVAIAGYLPARKAMRVDPLEALREE